MFIESVECPVCCEYFARDCNLVLHKPTNELVCESNNAAFIAGGGTDCGFHVSVKKPVEEIRGRLKEERIAALVAMGASRK